MDPQTDLPDLVEDLEVNIDELTTTLAPLLPPSTLSKTATSLPLLEKAKLYTLAAYAVESVLFSTLQASGSDAKAHPIFAELARLKSYFAKIKYAEDHFANLAAKEGRARLDVGAAARFIKHGLAGNERYDEMRKDRVAREKERALEKARDMVNRTFDDDEGTPRKRGAEDEATPNKKARLDVEHGDVEDEDDDEDDKEEEEDDDDEDDDDDTPVSAPKKRPGRTKRTAKQTAETEEEHQDPGTSQQDGAGAGAGAEAMHLDTPAPAKKRRGRPSKKEKAAAEAATPQKDTPTRATRSSAPKARNHPVQAPASASPATASKSHRKTKAKAKAK